MYDIKIIKSNNIYSTRYHQDVNALESNYFDIIYWVGSLLNTGSNNKGSEKPLW